MNADEVIAALEEYQTDFQRILSRFHRTNDGIHMQSEDDPVYRQKVLEVRDLLNDALGLNSYSRQIAEYYSQGIANFTGSPSYKSVEDIIGVLGAALTRLRRNPDLVRQSQAPRQSPINKNVFIIHGRDEAKWRELKDILRDGFRLNPIVLQEQADAGCPTVIKKFELYAENCSYAIAIFTPDDEVKNPNGETYLQARPNVIGQRGHPLAGRSRSTDISREKNFLLSPFFLLAPCVIFR